MNSDQEKKAVLLLSGGLDSTTVLSYALSKGYRVHALSFRYGQRHEIELDAVQTILKSYPTVSHHIVNLDLSLFTTSALTHGIEVPKSTELHKTTKIPVTYVPARNTIFLSYALGYAETIGAYDLFFGANEIDYSNYPDCRPEYVAAFENLAQIATANGVEKKGRYKIHVPLLSLSKSQIIQLGTTLGVDYSLTTSCYDPDAFGKACGGCEACHLRKTGFKEAGVKDPTRYQ